MKFGKNVKPNDEDTYQKPEGEAHEPLIACACNERYSQAVRVTVRDKA